MQGVQHMTCQSNNIEIEFAHYSTAIVMKKCSAYGVITTHSEMEATYENPQWIDIRTMQLVYKIFKFAGSIQTAVQIAILQGL